MTRFASSLLIACTWAFLLTPLTLVNGLGSSSSTLAVVYGTGTVCGIVAGEPTQRVGCYQSDDDHRTIFSVLPNISFQEISGGRSFLCGLRRGGLNLICWDGAAFRAKRIYRSDSVGLTDLTVGGDQVCTREATTGLARCWRGGGGSDGGGERPANHRDDDLDPFRGLRFSKIACGSGFVCGILRNNSKVFCWGSEVFRVQSGFGNTSMLSLVAGESHACGLTVSGALICKGNNDSGQLNVPSNGSFEFSGLALGANFTCAIRRGNGSVTCWGDFGTDDGVFGTVTFESIVSGSDFVCGLSSRDSSVFCWGRGWSGPRSNHRRLPIGPFVRSPHSEIEFPLAVPLSSKKQVPRSSAKRKLLSAFVMLILIAFSICFSVLLCRSASDGAAEYDHSNLISQAPERFSLSELAAATGNFSAENRVGFGSFGVVYRGNLSDGREVAVKRGQYSSTKRSFREKEAAFESELATLSRLRHKHLVSLLGFCREDDERLLVYEYMPNGSLHHHLHGGGGGGGGGGLGSWRTRIRVALEAARGVEYLHDRAEPPVIHRDIKSSNILLGPEMTAKLSDFGLSAAGREVAGAAAGTVGYVDPECYVSNVSTAKSDVYGLGVVMLELLTGKRAVFRSDGDGVGVTSVVEFAAKGLVLDRRVAESGGGGAGEGRAVEVLAATALRCVSMEGDWRPTVGEVVSSLETAFALCQ